MLTVSILLAPYGSCHNTFVNLTGANTTVDRGALGDTVIEDGDEVFFIAGMKTPVTLPLTTPRNRECISPIGARLAFESSNSTVGGTSGSSIIAAKARSFRFLRICFWSTVALLEGPAVDSAVEPAAREDSSIRCASISFC